MITVSGLSIYPVKSLAGVDLQSVCLDRFGFTGDRRWMVIDGSRRFLSQRELPAMAVIKTQSSAGALRLSLDGESVLVPRPAAEAPSLLVRVWEDSVIALDAGGEAANWLSDRLGRGCRLVYMGDDSQRLVDGLYAQEGETVSFADGFPVLMVSLASLEDLNSRLSQSVPMNRFRPNLVVEGCEAFAEDRWRKIRIGDMVFRVVKPCSRCVMPSIDQATGQRDGEILRVLAAYRRGADRQTYFGQNLLYAGSGSLRTGDAVEVLEQDPA